MICVQLDDARAPYPLTPEYLSRSVTPYVSALSILQTVANTVQGREDPLTIDQISSKAKGAVLCLYGANDVIRFAVREIPLWQQAHSESILTMREFDEMLTWLTDSETQEKILLERDHLRLRLQPDMLRLVLDFLSHISPDIPELGQVVHVDRLLAAFHLLAFSTIKLVIPG